MTALETPIPTSAALISVLQTTWDAIRKQHPDTPEAILTFGDGNRGKKLAYGHFATHMWKVGERTVCEVFVGGEGLERGALATFGTLMHEAAHGVAHTREVKDTSRQGNFHNAKFKVIGEELGLELQHSKEIGWSVTTVPDATALIWEEHIAALDGVIGMYRLPAMKRADASANKNNLVSECACGRKMRMSKRTMELGPVVCGVCDEPFELQEP